MDVLKLTVIGHLACDPQPGHGTVKLSLVATYRWTDKQERPSTVAIYARGKLAQICKKYLKQGSRVYCEAHQEEDGAFIAEEIIVLASGRRESPLTNSSSQVT